MSIHREHIYLNIPGKPIAKQSARHKCSINWVKHEHKRWSFFPQNDECKEVRKIISQQYQGPLLDDGLFIYFNFHIGIRPSWNKKQKQLALEGKILPIGKPDASNLAKFYEDCMKGIIYTDDARLIGITPIKRYDETWFTEICITPFRFEDYERFEKMATFRND